MYHPGLRDSPEIRSAASTKHVQISVIIPIHNAGTKISLFLQKINEILATVSENYEVLTIDDGSIDNTLDVLRKEEEGNSHVKVISYVQNCGKGHAVKTGVLQSSGDVIAFVDGDLDISPTVIDDYIKELKECDLVIASKRHPLSKVGAPLSRKLLSRVFNLLIRSFFGMKIKDTQSGLKAGRGDCLRTIFENMVVKRYAFDVELLAIATFLNLKIKEMPIEITINHRFNFQDIMKMILDVTGIWYKYKLKYTFNKKDVVRSNSFYHSH